MIEGQKDGQVDGQTEGFRISSLLEHGDNISLLSVFCCCWFFFSYKNKCQHFILIIDLQGRIELDNS